MKLEEFNKLEESIMREELLKCCGSVRWANLMLRSYPFISLEDVKKKAEMIWHEQCTEEDWLEAFAHHPKIGDAKSLQEKFASTKDWAGAEQAGVNAAGSKIIKDLANQNKEYEDKFGFIFIVCATGKTAEEMLDILRQRLPNSYDSEIKIAMEEQNKITQIRLEKLLS
jgi:2-oxo-4-hydroxy-4-carboxy-5-ureidoimidazoline decarboxylase